MKPIITIICLLLVSTSIHSQSICKPPTYSFNKMTNVSGSGGVGSIYRFDGSLTGMNTFVIITKLQNATITNSNMDIVGNFALAWQPTINFTSATKAGDSSYVEFTVKFIDIGSGANLNSINNNMVSQGCMAMTIVDIDGPGNSNTFRELVKVSQSAKPVGIKNSTVLVNEDTRWINMISGPAQFSSIDTSNYQAMAQIEFPQNTQQFAMRVGAVGAVAASSNRQFSFYFKSFTGLDFVLPVKLMSFDSRLTNDYSDVQLNWSTASEQDADRFEVFRSFDGVSYHVVGSVSASGNSQQLKEYEFTDPQITSFNKPFAFYKLKMIETNGSFEWSNNTKVNIGLLSGNGSVSVNPNPSSNIVNLNFATMPSSDIHLEIVDVYGKSIQKIDHPVINGQVLSMDISNFINGLYFIHILNKENDEVSMVKFVKE